MADPSRRSRAPGWTGRPPREGPGGRHPIGPTDPEPSTRRITGPMFIDTATGTFRDLRPSPPTPPAMSRREFEAERQRILRAYGSEAGSPSSVRCVNSSRSVSCMFCTDCEECYRCTHSSGCKTSSHLTHCSSCVDCHDCAYCVSCENCVQSNYLVLSRSCFDCSYCFGCVGLVKADFHILNVKYTRSEYFRIVKGLEKELGLG